MKIDVPKCEECLCASVCKYKEHIPKFKKELEDIDYDADWPFHITLSCVMFKQNRGTVRF